MKTVIFQNQEVSNVTVDILFEETHYSGDNKKYIVWCIDKQLFGEKDQSTLETTFLLSTVHDCKYFLWRQTREFGVLENIQELCLNFLSQENNFETESLQGQKDLIGNLYSQCLQVSLKHVIFKEKVMKNVQFLDSLKLAVETYMQYCLGKKLMYGVNSLQHYSDSVFNKIVRNSSDIKVEDLNISSELYSMLNPAKYELSKLNKYSTVLDKIYCLKKVFNYFFENVNGVEIFCFTSDDFLQTLVYLILKCNVNNWIANLTYLIEFKFCTLEVSSQNSFLITTLEAALEYIKSNEFLAIKSNLINQMTADNLKENETFFEMIYNNIRSGSFKSLPDLIENKQNLCRLKLCHPLCMCSNCENLVGVIGNKVTNKNNQNLLIYASLQGHIDVVQFLLSGDCDLNALDSSGKSALHYAASKGFQDILLFLVNAGADVNILDTYKNTALHIACDKGHENCVKALIFSSAFLEINLQNTSGETPLFLATKWAYFDIVRLLLENGASVCLKNNRNQTVYKIAPNYYVTKLFENFCKENSNNISREIHDTKNYASLDQSYQDLSNEFSSGKDYGAKPKSKDEFKTVNLLLKAIENNDLPLACFYLGFTASSSKLNSSDLLSRCHPLCACKKCVNGPDSDSEAVQDFKNIPNINACNVNGHTALHAAAKFGRTEILRILLDSGALPNLKTYRTSSTPLHLAVLTQQTQIIRELLKCGTCAVDPQDAKGNTPLYYACLKNDVRIVELLLANGADCRKKNYNGKSVLQEAENKNQYRIFRLLKESLSSFKRDDVQNSESDLFDSLF
ncbi:ankyrin repeat domain-containing protein 27-like isoform X2 [Cylas formicarius]|uniref:ankyrin repeat domain-containing protein 27-like isoform X2 n=1 Tax=Cylas formicarius TaxID=197179 RepID=UPI002958BBDD|nr:ankyrin repeat domain-containing protein 27-like isoform X2 [Cylas formicarius]XP_060521933.1 ankyrin repeat domain-containing protein 27-like isoform X2 [Cylas formicarius]